MSLILEALRKSEAERRRGEMPGLRAELPPPVPAQHKSLRRAWPWIVAVAAIAIAIATVLPWHPWSRDAASTAPAPIASNTDAEPIRMQPRPRPAIAPRVDTPRIAEREPPKPRPAPQATTHAPAPVADIPPQAIPESEPARPAAADSQETTVNALPADLRKALPTLQLSMHMWDPDPAKRFVILDGERYAEGDSVGPMRIRRIDAGGVLFDWQGRSIRLPLR